MVASTHRADGPGPAARPWSPRAGRRSRWLTPSARATSSTVALGRGPNRRMDVLGRGQDPIAGERGVSGWHVDLSRRRLPPPRSFDRGDQRACRNQCFTSTPRGGDPVQLRQGFAATASTARRPRFSRRWGEWTTCRELRGCWATGGSSHASATLHRRDPESGPATDDRVDDCSGVNPPRRERTARTAIGPVGPKSSIRGVVAAVGQVVVVLHAHDVSDCLSFGPPGQP